MSQIYANRRRADTAPAVTGETTTAQGPSLAALQAGAMPSTEQMGHRVDLPEAIRAKMEASFGADLSGVQLYESQTVADAGASAMAMGNKIGFAPGKLDFSSSGGQALLGHELSHVVSQARGEVTGGGFLNDHALEARADREGAMAAAGESVYSGPVTPISAGSSAMSSAGPMQAKKSPDSYSPKAVARRHKVQDMFAIKMSMMNDEDSVSEKDREWYEKKIQSASPRTMKEMLYQQGVAGALTISDAYRRDEEGRTPEQQDRDDRFAAKQSVSKEARDFDGYRELVNDILFYSGDNLDERVAQLQGAQRELDLDYKDTKASWYGGPKRTRRALGMDVNQVINQTTAMLARGRSLDNPYMRRKTDADVYDPQKRAKELDEGRKRMGGLRKRRGGFFK